MLTGTDGTKVKMSCPMKGISVGNENWTEFICSGIPIDGLAAFGGGNSADDCRDEGEEKICSVQ